MRVKIKIPESVQYAVISLIIIFYLAMQGAATFIVSHRYYSNYFPFVSYPMYEASHREGDKMYPKFVVLATLDDNTEVELQQKDVGLNYWQFRSGFVKAIWEKKRPEIMKYLNYYKGPEGRHFKSIKVQSYPVRITRDGPQTESLQVLQTVQLSSEEGNP